MTLGLITPPTALPVTVAEAKAHMRVVYDHEDDYISDLIRAATARLNGPYGLLGRCILTQTWRVTLPVLGSTIVLPLGPHQSVDSIVYLDANHDTVTIDPTAYVVDYLDTDTPAVITRIDGARWPQTVSVTFTAGYGDDEDFTPAPIRQAILMDVAQMYERRESATYAVTQTETLFGYHDLIAPFRVVAF